MSRGVYRGIYSALPDDPDFQRLGPDARLTLLVARLCSQAGPAAIFRYYPELLCAQTGLTMRRLEGALGELERGLWIYREGVIIWIRNGLRHDPCTHLANANHQKSVVRWLKALPKLKIVLTFCDYYSLPYPFDSPSNGLRIGSETKDSDTEILPDTDTESDSEGSRIAMVSNGRPAKVAGGITEALNRSARLGAVPRLRAVEFWNAEAAAAGGDVDLAGEVLKAEAWLCANRRGPTKDLPRFLHNWLRRAKESQV